MTDDHKTEAWRSEDGREWRIGGDAEVAWIEENTPSGLRITSAIPPVFEAYVTLELPGTGNHAPGSLLEKWEQLDKEWELHGTGVLALLSEHSEPQPWWLGYLETGAADLIFNGAQRTRFYADWPYVLIEAGPEQARSWRENCSKGVLPDLMFPADRSWIFGTRIVRNRLKPSST
jgi:hypothetical protein